jgi:hypothetical protein
MKTYTITSNYSLSITQMIELGKFGHVDPFLSIQDWESFPTWDKTSHLVKKQLALHDPGEILKAATERGSCIEKVNQQMSDVGLKPARFEDLLALGAQYQDEEICVIPEGQARFLSALGSTKQTKLPELFGAPCLRIGSKGNIEGGRSLMETLFRDWYLPGHYYVGVVIGSEMVT